jgi:tetratricopeptide (TPR) repeat protein
MRRYIVILVSLFIAAAVFAAGSSGGGGGSTGAKSTSAPAQPTAVDKYNAGYALWNKGKYADAAPYFAEAISMKSDYAEAYNMLGFCTRMAGDLPKAIGYYETALKLKPNFPEAREYYGETWLKQGNLPKAVQQYIILNKMHSKNANELLEKISDYVDQQM